MTFVFTKCRKFVVPKVIAGKFQNCTHKILLEIQQKKKHAGKS